MAVTSPLIYSFDSRRRGAANTASNEEGMSSDRVNSRTGRSGNGRPLRVMLYCHDSYGLGHLRRTLRLSRGLRARWPGTSQLIVTGSPLAQRFLLPDDADYVKLPSVVKVDAGEYDARSLSMPFPAIRELRSEIILSAARHFRPDALVVDHVPAGLEGELLPALRYLASRVPPARLVVGLRDIVDEPAVVRQAWTREGVYELLDDVYDRILVYGERGVYDVVSAYGLSASAAAKTRFVGYLRPDPPGRPRNDVRSRLELRNGRLVVASAGGGGDGYDLFECVLRAASSREGRALDWLLVGGPLMAREERERLVGLVPRGGSVRFVEFLPDLVSYLAAADAVVSMGGYNAVCEILSVGTPAVIVPRTWPRKEQLIRAEILARRGLARAIHPAELTPERLLEQVTALVRERTEPRERLHLNGVGSIAAELRSVLAQPPDAPALTEPALACEV